MDYYRDILKRYMMHILEVNGWPFIEDSASHSLSDGDKMELEKILEEIRKES